MGVCEAGCQLAILGTLVGVAVVVLILAYARGPSRLPGSRN